MTNNEVNKVIAKYMGYTFRSTYSGELYIEDESTARFKAYTNSLDALVPVWEKMDIPNILEMDIRNHTQPVFAYRVYADLAYTHHHEAKTIQEAAAHATAKAILELNRE
jgi:hypothetical protein